MTNAPQVLFEVESTDVRSMKDYLVSVISPFSNAFTYLALRKSGSNGTDHRDQALPALGLNLLFPGQYQGNAQCVLERLSHPPWQAIPLPEHVQKSLDHPELRFYNTKLDLPQIGIKTGCPAVGVQLVVFVQNESNFDRMMAFYQTILGHQFINRTVRKTHLTYCVFALSQRAELLLAYYPGIKVTSLRTSTVYVQINDVSSVQGIIKLGADHWYTNDPEGNRVILYKTLRH